MIVAKVFNFQNIQHFIVISGSLVSDIHAKQETSISTAVQPSVTMSAGTVLCNKSSQKSICLRSPVRISAGENPQKPYCCALCSKSFLNSEGLEKHRRSHTGEKPYTCTSCNKSYSRYKNLVKHLKTCGEEKSFICSFCSK